MACDMESLNHLEALLTEFYSPIADNAKKKEIDKILTEFSQQPAAWKSCLFYMSHTRNDHVLMFSLKVIEIGISIQCVNFASEDKAMIRQSCYQMLMSGTALSFYVRNKLMKLIVSVARFDWPHNYQTFLVEINHLLSVEEHVLLGLNFLVVASEDFGSSKEDISSKRKGELNELFKSNTPALLHKVSGILREVRLKIDASLTGHLSLTNGLMSKASCCVEDKWLNILKLGLECTTCLLGWFEPGRIEDEGTMLQALFGIIVELATSFLVVQQSLQCCPSQCRFQVAELALTCICEVLSMRLCSKLLSTSIFPYFLSDLHKHIRQILALLVNESQNIWSYLNEGRYLSKMIDYLHLFFKNHIRNFEADHEFFQLLIKFTFEQQPYTSLYVSCLLMWADFFEYLNCQKTDRFHANEDINTRYKAVVLEVMVKVLTSIQFKNNQSHLESLDDDILDDDFKTEWQNYLLENTEVILKASKLYHKEVIGCLDQPFQESMRTYFELGNYVQTAQGCGEASTGHRRSFAITAENDCKRLHCTLRDLSTFLHIFASMVDNFIGSHLREDFETGCILFQRLLSLIEYASKMKFHEVDSAIKNVLELDFIEVHAQSLAAVKAWCPFLSHLRSDPLKWSALGPEGNLMIPSVLHSLLPLFRIEMLPEKILLSASQLLLSFVTEVKPPLIDPSFHILFSSGITMTTAPPKAVMLTYRALFLHLVISMPPQKVDEELDLNKRLLREFCGFLFKDFSSVYEEVSRSVPNIVSNESANAIVQRCMETVTDIILSLTGITSKKVEVCYLCLLQYIEQAINMLFTFIGKKDTSSKMMGFFHAIIQTFKSQMGAQLIKNVLEQFMVLFSRSLIMETLREDESSGHELIEKLLQIFEILVRDGSQQSRNFLPSILDLCLNRILPVVAERPCPIIKPALFGLFFSTFKSNWGVFSPSTPSSVKMMNARNNLNNEFQSQYQEYFATIMTAYESSIPQPDVELARQLLDQLENLNKQFKLYSKPAFRDQFLPRFLFLLMSALIQKVHDLLREEIMIVVFNLASVDFGFFYKSFVPHLLNSCPLREDQSRFLLTSLPADEDLPSFSRSVHSFVADLRFFLNGLNQPATHSGPPP